MCSNTWNDKWQQYNGQVLYTRNPCTFHLLYSALMMQKLQSEFNWPIKQVLQSFCTTELPAI